MISPIILAFLLIALWQNRINHGLIFILKGREKLSRNFEKWRSAENEGKQQKRKLSSEADFKDYEIFGDVESRLVHNYWNTDTNI